MGTLSAAAAFVVFAWWLSTGVCLRIGGLPRRAHRLALLAVTVLAGAAVHGLAWSADVDTPGAAYLAFGCTLALWGWNELLFLSGIVTGPRREVCPAAARGLRRFACACQAILYHELLLLASGVTVVAVTWGGENLTGPLAFGALWVMRVSAKLNLFLGVRNAGEEFLPRRMRYLASYFAHAPMNALLPFSVTAGTAVAVLLLGQAVGADIAGAASTRAALVGVLVALGVLEHWFMVVPVSTTWLWEWGLRGEPPAATRERAGESRATGADRGVVSVRS